MTPAQRELFRENLLVQLGQAVPYAVTTAILAVNAKAGGFQVTPDEVTAELHYLSEKGLVQASNKLVSPEVKRWEITAIGRDYLAEAGLA